MNRVWIGVDVGGTFTDAVAVRAGEVIATAKVPTETAPARGGAGASMDGLSRSLLGALDGVLTGLLPGEVARVGLSTTLITNLLAQGLVPPVATLLIPGPGRDPATYAASLGGAQTGGRQAWVVGGAVDLSGREVAPLDRDEVMAALREIRDAGYRHLAVAAKFSPRNPALEDQALAWAREVDPAWRLCAGHAVSGQLNYPRRVAAATLTLAVQEPYRAFFDQLRAVFGARGLDGPIVILKADGGTLPLAAAERAPLQSIFSGPAASTMGVLAQRPAGATSVVVDVGGTTTDLALILDGEPLFSSRGGALDGLYLPTRAFAVRSLAVGGDSSIASRQGVGRQDVGRQDNVQHPAKEPAVALLDTRAGVAACLGGPEPTLTDALRLAGRTRVGDERLARAALARVGEALGLEAEEVAALAIEQALARIEAGIEEMFRAWQREQVYRIWQLKQRSARRPDVVVGVGAAAEPLAPALAERLGARVLIPPYAPVANALGAALARTTYTTTLHVDTGRRRFEVAEEGLSRALPRGYTTLEDARRLAREWMARRGEALGVADPLDDCEEVLAEQFNVVEGWTTVGRMFDVRLERRCGLVDEWSQEGAE